VKIRSTVVALGAAVAMVVPSTPASAANVAVFHGTATIGCFGCGQYGPVGNSASFTVSGILNGVTAVNAAGTATFTVLGPIGSTCLLSGAARGSLTVAGVGSTEFFWTRVGAAVVVTTGWGTGEAAFAITSPLGNPCGGSVDATFAGMLAAV
jgi:hypothetical protein